MASIELVNIHKRFGNTEVLRDISIQVNDGEFVVLVGPSGCGKSTALRMIAGLEEPTQGDIKIGNRVVNDVPARDRDIAMVFQSYALYPHMNVFENMAFGLKMRKVAASEIDTRVKEAAGVLGLSELLRRKPKELSGGQRQRVALGRALVRKPQVFLFDEPLSNLDAKLRTQTRTELSRLHKQLGTTMIYVTHDQVEAMTLGQRIVVLHKGLVQQMDTPLNMYQRPANRFVAGFIGSPSMNFIEGTVQGREFTTPGLSFALPPRVNAQHGLVLGLRPEQIQVSAGAPGTAKPVVGAVPTGDRRYDVVTTANGPVQFAAIVDVVEPLGNEMLVYARVGEERLVVRADPHAPCRPDDRVTLSFDPAAVHYFDKTSEHAIGAK